MESGKVLIGLNNKCYFLRLVGDVRVPWCVSLENYCEAVVKQAGVEEVTVDLTQAENVDSTTLGVLAKLAILTQAECGRKAKLLCNNDDLLRLVRSMAFEQVFDIDESGDSESMELEELPYVDCSELEMQESVIDAHRTLMDISEDNRAEFIQLVTALERSQAERLKSDS